MLSQAHHLAAAPAAADATPSSKKPPFPIEKLSIELASPDNYGELCDLVDMQAVEHNTTIKGNRRDFYKALLSDDPTEKILSGMILRDKDTEEAVGYILTSKFHSPEGDGIYLEDFMMVPHMQNRGLGTFSFDILQEIAKEEACTLIACTVDASKDNSRRFYERVGMQQNPVPLLSMGSFRMGNTDQGAIVVLDRGDLAKVQTTGSLTVSEKDIQAQNLTHVRIADASLKPASVRRMTAADIDHLAALDLVGVRDQSAMIASLQSCHNDPQGFGVVEADETGTPRALILASTTYSTFNNCARTNIGPAFSVDGQPVTTERLLNMVAFCQRNPQTDKLEVQLQPVARSQPGTDEMIGMCVSLMTEHANSHETPYVIRVADMGETRITRDMHRVLHPSAPEPFTTTPLSVERSVTLG